MTITDYKEWYIERYGIKPTNKLIESFCRLNKLPWPPEEETIYWVPPKVNMLFGGEAER